MSNGLCPARPRDHLPMPAFSQRKPRYWDHQAPPRTEGSWIATTRPVSATIHRRYSKESQDIWPVERLCCRIFREHTTMTVIRQLKRALAVANSAANHIGDRPWNTSHPISKAHLDTAQRTGQSIAMEDLSGIRQWTRGRCKQHKQPHTWPRYPMRPSVSRKAKRAGVAVQLVDPRSTSDHSRKRFSLCRIRRQPCVDGGR